LNQHNQHVVVVGGGPVGAAFALALADSGLQVTVLEARQASAPLASRAIALSESSRLILERLGVWGQLKADAAPIRSIHISEKGRFGRTLLTAEQFKHPALGYVVDYVRLGTALEQALTERFQLHYGATVSTLVPDDHGCTVNFDQDGTTQSIRAQLTVVADGGRSINNIPGLNRETRDYGQSALVARVKTELPHNFMAFERFTKNGPVALLPWNADEMALVWVETPEQAERVCQLSDTEFLSELHRHFGDRLGRFTSVGNRNLFPLKMASIRPATAQHIAVIGNAAQTLHPIAGQGFNLGLRDAWELAQNILAAPEVELGSAAMLAQYGKSRRKDAGAGMLFTDFLVQTFSKDIPMLGGLRGAGLAALELFAPAKQYVMQKMSFGAQK
jgi:2-octaprenyl-6-methoxyphenol hydroxylase